MLSYNIPVTIYQPEGASETDVIFFAHGIGGNGAVAFQDMLTEYAEQGYTVIAPTFSGSSTQDAVQLALEDGFVGSGPNGQLTETDIPDAARFGLSFLGAEIGEDNLEALESRGDDISHLIDQLEADPTLGGLVSTNPNDIALVGHSLGAHTTLSMAGATIQRPDGTTLDITDDRIDSFVAISPPANDTNGDGIIGPGEGVYGLNTQALNQIDPETPIMILTGESDAAPGTENPADRTLIADVLTQKNADNVAIAFADTAEGAADHAAYQNGPLSIQYATQGSTLAFIEQQIGNVVQQEAAAFYLDFIQNNR